MDTVSDTGGSERLCRIGVQRDILGECPVWDDRANALYWVDIRQPAIRRYRPDSGEVDTWLMPDLVGSIALCTDERLLVALSDRIVLWQIGTDRFQPVVTLPDAQPGHRCNDGRCDRQGRFWVGTMHNVTRAPEGVLYRLDGRRLTPVLDGICIPNSLAWSQDGKTMYFSDSLTYGIDRFDFDIVSGTIGERRRWVDTRKPAFPDGSAVDELGNLWNAEFNGGRVVCYAPDGAVRQEVALPYHRPTACAFGGAGLATLFVSSTSQNMTEQELEAAPLAGALFALDVGVRGLPDPRYNPDDDNPRYREEEQK